MKVTHGGIEHPGNARLAQAFDDGMTAKVASAVITDNPHASGTQEYVAWRRGWRLYTSGGTTVQPGSGSQAAAYSAPLVSFAVVENEASWGLDISFSLYEQELPGAYHFGDGSAPLMTEDGVATHSFPAAGTYLVGYEVLGVRASEAEVIIIHKTTTIAATKAFSTATSTIAATYKEDGVGAVADVAAVSSNTGVFTVATPVESNSSGLATFTLTKVAAGTATLTVTAAGGPSAVCTVTVT
jgi:hypothetical protein